MAQSTGTSTEAHGGHGAVFPPFDATTFPSQLLWLAITFGLLYYLSAKVLLPRIGKILDIRRERVMGDLDAARRAREESEAARLAYEKALADAKANAAKLAQETRDALQRELDARRAKAEGELGARLAAAETEIAAMRAKAMGEVGAIAQETAEAIVGRLAGAPPARGELVAAVTDAMKR